MAKELASRNQQVAPVSDMNWAEEYGSEAFQSNIVGRLLKFSKGEWLAGLEEEEIPLGSKFVAATHLLQSGWMRWENSTPVETIKGVRADGFRPPLRESLGHTDKSQWEQQADRPQPRDPWQRTDWLLMADPKTGEIYTYSPNSEGGLGAVKMLSKEYGTNMRQHPNEIPVVELGSTFYKHVQFGKVYKPVLTIVEYRNVNDISFKPPDQDEEEVKAAPRRAETQKPAPIKSKRR